MAIQIFHVKGTRSVRVIWLCEELSVPYEIVPIDFSADYRNSDEWRAMSPTGKVPAMTDGGMTMFESGAMVQYILEKHGQGRLQPEPGTADRAIFLQWCWFAEATLARPLGDMVHHLFLKPEAERLPEMVVDGEKRARVCLEAVNSALQDQDYLLPEYTAADIMMGYSLLLAARVEVLDNEYPLVQAYFEKLQARPGYQLATA
ncbi:MAG: glutathione S-transferase family protein [Gammaproteobacteria bacterium]|nr:glutathione S-transferase family protein [Gammaproteobacteria bacterium]